MTSFLIISPDQLTRQTHIQTLCQQHHIHQFDITTLQKDETTKNLNSLGIGDIQTLQKKLYLKPLQSPTKAIIIDDAHLLTIEAQNSLLKTLEEPPAHTIIILSTPTQEPLLPTILSRCQIINLATASPQLTTEEEQTYTQFLQTLPTLKTGDLLKKAETLAKTKEEPLRWLEKLILFSHDKLLTTKNPKNIKYYANLIQKLQTAYKTLKTTNANPRFTLEQTLLSLK